MPSFQNQAFSAAAIPLCQAFPWFLIMMPLLASWHGFKKLKVKSAHSVLPFMMPALA